MVKRRNREGGKRVMVGHVEVKLVMETCFAEGLGTKKRE